MKLQESLDAFHDLGAAVWVISPDPADRLKSMREEKGLKFPNLMDPELAVTRSYGLQNEASPSVPHPAALVIDRSGKITYLRVDEGVVERPEPEELLAALKALAPAEKAGP